MLADDADLDNELIEREEATHVRELLSTLTPREERVLSRHLGERTLNEIGRELGLTRERVRQIEAKALGKLRSMIDWRYDTFS